jgi:hypothetical protein
MNKITTSSKLNLEGGVADPPSINPGELELQPPKKEAEAEIENSDLER